MNVSDEVKARMENRTQRTKIEMIKVEDFPTAILMQDPHSMFLIRTNGDEWRDMNWEITIGSQVLKKMEPTYIRGKVKEIGVLETYTHNLLDGLKPTQIIELTEYSPTCAVGYYLIKHQAYDYAATRYMEWSIRHNMLMGPKFLKKGTTCGRIIDPFLDR